METTERILQAARARFSDYGPSKTTMAEIAADCRMSVGNLYRHFANKQAMMVACVQQQLQEKLDAGIAAAAMQEDPLEALRGFLQTRLRLAHAQFADTRHLFDLLHAIESHHRDLLLAYEAKVIDALADILQRGMACGRFARRDARQLAYDIHQATLRYNHPVTLKHHPLEALRGDLDRLVDLLDAGLRSSR